MEISPTPNDFAKLSAPLVPPSSSSGHWFDSSSGIGVGGDETTSSSSEGEGGLGGSFEPSPLTAFANFSAPLVPPSSSSGQLSEFEKFSQLEV